MKRRIELVKPVGTDVELGKAGSKWEHGYVPLNPAAVALKAHRKPGSEGATKNAAKIKSNAAKQALKHGDTVRVSGFTHVSDGRKANDKVGKVVDSHLTRNSKEHVTVEIGGKRTEVKRSTVAKMSPVEKAEHTGHVGDAKMSDLAARRTNAELNHIVSSGPNTPEGRVARAELQKRSASRSDADRQLRDNLAKARKSKTPDNSIRDAARANKGTAPKKSVGASALRDSKIRNAEIMLGSDRSKWKTAQLKAAAKLGDGAAVRELAKRNVSTAKKPPLAVRAASQIKGRLSGPAKFSVRSDPNSSVEHTTVSSYQSGSGAATVAGNVRLHPNGKYMATSTPHPNLSETELVSLHGSKYEAIAAIKKRHKKTTD